ncbi:MAG: hypothetical protein U1F51_06950 [Burkholderiales bacterium]
MPDRLLARLSRLLACAVAALVIVLPARAAEPDYTDVWWTEGGVESGWGVNFTQGPGVIFATFFVFGPDKKPVWYVSSMNRVGTGRYAGALYAVTGSWFGGVWLPTDATETLVGNVLFVAESLTRGAFTYNVGTTPVVKTIERLALTPVELAGTYIGGMLIKNSPQCNGGAATDRYPYQLIVTEGDEASVRIDQITLGGSTTCVMEGTAAQFGRVRPMPNGKYTCGDLVTTVAISDLRRTSNDGIELAWVANLGNGCTETGSFSGVPQL